jgi:hypothetical protein
MGHSWRAKARNKPASINAMRLTQSSAHNSRRTLVWAAGNDQKWPFSGTEPAKGIKSPFFEHRHERYWK